MASMDVLTDIMPATSQLVQNGAEYASEFQQHMNQIRSQGGRLKQVMDKNVYRNILSESKSNLIKDLKAGNFYVQDTYDDGFDDDDFNFDDFDVGGDEDFDFDVSSSDGSTQVSSKHTKGSDIDVNNTSIKVNNTKVANAIGNQTKVMVELNEISNKQSQAFNKTLLAELTNSGRSQLGVMQSIDSNVTSIVSVAQTMAQSSSVAMKYYDDSINLFTSIKDTLIEIKTHITGSGGSIAGDTSRYGNGKYDNILDTLFSGGVLDLKAYKDVAGKQVKDAVASNLVLSSIINMASDTDTLASILKHPLNLVSKGIVGTLIPSLAKEAASAFDRTLSGSMETLLYRLRGLKDSDNPIFSFLGQAFGVGNRLKTDVDRSNYNKGKVDWNGESHKTLNEVIPYYLRKIAASLTGTKEMGYDYEKGVFRAISDMRSDYESEDRREMLKSFSSTISTLKDNIKASTTFTSKDEENATYKAIEDLAIKMMKTDGTSARMTNGNFLKYFADMIAGGDTNDQTAQIIAAAFQGMSNAEKQEFLVRNPLEARAAYSKRKIQEESGELATNNRYIKDGTGDADTHLILDKTDKQAGRTNYTVSPFIDHDKYGKTSTMYLRDIYRLLLNGIIVFPLGGGRKNTEAKARLDYINKSNSVIGTDSEYQKGYGKVEKTIRSEGLTEGQLKDVEKNGKTIIDGVSGDREGLYDEIVTADQNRARQAAADSDKKKSVFGKFFNLSEDKPIVKLMNKFTQYIQKPGEIVSDFFKKADDFIFKLTFGGVDNSGSFFKTAIAKVKKTMSNVGVWINDKILEPIQDKLFGEEGVFTKMKNSEFMKSMKSKFAKAGEWFMGTKNADGIREGGLFSEVANEFTSIGKDAKRFLFGKDDDSVLSNIKRTGRSLFDNVLTSMGIDLDEQKRKRQDPNYHPIREALNTVGTKIKTAGSMTVDAIFGGLGKGEKEGSEFKERLAGDIKKMGKGAIGAGAGLGIIGSFFLPGGPIIGALMGMGTMIASRSDTIKELLFGKIDDEGIRQGGIINKEISGAFSKNKTGLAVGGIGGLAASVGLLPSFFFPGGPIGGALIGMGASMAFKSEAMQKFLFGEDDGTGKRTGGALGKLGGLFKNAKGVTDKGRFINAGIGAGVGFLGSFFLPGGPIVGSLLGGALGFASGSEKFQNFLFGEVDEKTGKRKGGLIGGIANKISNAFMPGIKKAQAGLLGFMERGIMIPLMAGLKPIISIGANIMRSFKEKASNMFHYVGVSLKNFLVGDGKNGKGILSPLINIGKGMAKAVTGVAKSIISAPFRLIGAIGVWC